MSLLQQNMHHYNHINPNTEVLNLTFLLAEYWLLDKSFTSTNFVVTNFDTIESFNNLAIL